MENIKCSSGLHRGNCAQTCLCELHLVDMHTQATPTSVRPLGAAECLRQNAVLPEAEEHDQPYLSEDNTTW